MQVSTFMTDLMEFKDEVFKKVRLLENKVFTEINTKYSEMHSNYEKLDNRVTFIGENNDSLLETITAQKLNIDKIGELESFKNKTEQNLIMHDIKIKSLSTDLDKIKSKYDKTIYENLQVPGYIGPGCQYKSISEYITNNIFEFSKIKNNIDQMKIENIEVKNRLDNILKSTLNLIDSSVVRCQKYSDNKHQDMQKILDNKIVEISEKNMDLRTQISKTELQNEKQIESLKIDVEKLLLMKNEFITLTDQKIEEINKKIEIMTQEINYIKYKKKDKLINNNNNSNSKSNNKSSEEIINNNSININNIKKSNYKLQKNPMIINNNSYNDINKNNNNDIIKNNKNIINNNISDNINNIINNNINNNITNNNNNNNIKNINNSNNDIRSDNINNDNKNYYNSNIINNNINITTKDYLYKGIKDQQTNNNKININNELKKQNPIKDEKNVNISEEDYYSQNFEKIIPKELKNNNIEYNNSSKEKIKEDNKEMENNNVYNNLKKFYKNANINQKIIEKKRINDFSSPIIDQTTKIEETNINNLNSNINIINSNVNNYKNQDIKDSTYLFKNKKNINGTKIKIESLEKKKYVHSNSSLNISEYKNKNEEPDKESIEFKEYNLKPIINNKNKNNNNINEINDKMRTINTTKHFSKINIINKINNIYNKDDNNFCITPKGYHTLDKNEKRIDYIIYSNEEQTQIMNEIKTYYNNKKEKNDQKLQEKIVDCNVINLNLNKQTNNRNSNISAKNKLYLAKDNKLRNNISEIGMKISPAFGRTTYSFYNKKEINGNNNGLGNNRKIKSLKDRLNMAFVSSIKQKINFHDKAINVK